MELEKTDHMYDHGTASKRCGISRANTQRLLFSSYTIVALNREVNAAFSDYKRGVLSLRQHVNKR